MITLKLLIGKKRKVSIRKGLFERETLSAIYHELNKYDEHDKTSSATAEIDDGPCDASTLSSWRSESSNISLVVLDKLLF